MKLSQTISGWFLAITMPLFLIMIAVRILITPVFPEIEYRMPGFPDDPYGFTQNDRLHWARISIDYLINPEGIDWLGRFKLNADTPLYNQRELSHMLDVKNLVQTLYRIQIIQLIIFISITLWAWRSKWLRDLGKYLSWGGWITIGLIAAIMIGVATGFDALFTAFHHVFFKGDTWLFLYSDTLIRLFPMRFWLDAFILMGILTLACALASIILGSKMMKSASNR